MGGRQESNRPFDPASSISSQQNSESGTVQSIVRPNPFSDRKEWREEKNYKSQRDAAKWTRWAAIAAGTSALAAFIGIWLIYKTLLATKGMLDEAKKATQAAERSGDIQIESFQRLERPYLFPRIVLFDVDGNGPPVVQFEFVNFGKLPAVIVSYTGQLVEVDSSEITLVPPSKLYGVVEPGAQLPEYVDVYLRKNGDYARGVHFRADAIEKLQLNISVSYIDPTGARHDDVVVLNGNSSPRGFRFVSIERTTDRNTKPFPPSALPTTI